MSFTYFGDSVRGDTSGSGVPNGASRFNRDVGYTGTDRGRDTGRPNVSFPKLYAPQGTSRIDPTRDETHAIHLARHATTESLGGGGHKTIDFFGSLSFIVNNVTGPAMVTIPVVYQEAGWLLPTVAFIVCCIASSYAATMLCQAMAMVPGNEQYQDRIEFPTLVKFYFGSGMYWTTQFFINLSLHAMNIASIIVSGQVMDVVLIELFGQVCGVVLYPTPGSVMCVSGLGNDISPFSSDIIVFSCGFAIVMLLMMPLSFLNMDDTMWIQKLSFCLMTLMVSLWFVSFVESGMPYDLPPIKSAQDGGSQTQVIGNVLFNYAFVITIPSWCNERKHGVNVNTAVWSSTILSTIAFVSVGILGAVSFKYTGNVDLLAAMAQSKDASILTQIVVYSFPVVALLPSIPIFSIIVRYNLVSNDVCKTPLANIFAIGIPWLVSIPFYTGSGLRRVINWSSLFLDTAIDFIVPFIIFLGALAYTRQRNAERGMGHDGSLFDSSSSSRRHRGGHGYGRGAVADENGHDDDYDDAEDAEDGNETLGLVPRSLRIPGRRHITHSHAKRFRAVSHRCCISPAALAFCLLAIMSILAVAAIMLNITDAIHGNELHRHGRTGH